jgi:hypothetical protein
VPSVSWSDYAHDPQHSGVSDVASQPLEQIHWQTPVDLNPQFSGSDLLIHYGSPLVTANNTVIVPVKTGASDGFELEGIDGATGALKWTATTDYILPPHNWTPSYSPALSPSGRLYFAGVGGTIYYIDNPDANGATVSGHIAFYGIGNYNSSLDGTVFINTPLTVDNAGNLYFGFQVTGANSLGLQSGIARIGANGAGSWIAASTAAGDSNIVKVVHNCAPALSNDGQSLYVAVSTGSFGAGYLVKLDSTTLAPEARVLLREPLAGNAALLPDDGSASPTVGPDGDVYFGVLENPFNSSKGWLLHFSGDLSQTKIAGSFGWDDTASIVAASLVPSYHGTSSYLLMTKYNNYAGLGGDGINKIAILDPNDTQIDPRTGATVMKEVITIAGQTPYPEFPSNPGAVREWCINTAAVDPFTDSVVANSEDGKLYRWDLATNTFSQVITLTTATGEAYTPTVIGTDGTVYAINRATLFAVGQAPTGPDIGDAGFEAPSVGTGTWSAFQYDPSGTAWTYTGGAGVAGNDSGFTSGNPNAPEGSQVGFLQGTGSFSQSVNFTAGSYTLSFEAAQRGNYQAISQSFVVLIDSTVVGMITPANTSYASFTTSAFTVGAGAHTIIFLGLNPNGGDNTAFVDNVQLNAATTNQPGDPGFETPQVGSNFFGAFQYDPTGSPWTFSGGAGVSGNNSGFTSGNPAAPQDSQVGFLQVWQRQILRYE